MKNIFAQFCTILHDYAQFCAFLQAILAGKIAQKRTKKRKNAQKCIKTHHFAQTHATPPFIIPPLACPNFCEFWCFSLGKQVRFTLNFCSGMPL